MRRAARAPHRLEVPQQGSPANVPPDGWKSMPPPEARGPKRRSHGATAPRSIAIQARSGGAARAADASPRQRAEGHQRRKQADEHHAFAEREKCDQQREQHHHQRLRSRAPENQQHRGQQHEAERPGCCRKFETAGSDPHGRRRAVALEIVIEREQRLAEEREAPGEEHAEGRDRPAARPPMKRSRPSAQAEE